MFLNWCALSLWSGWMDFTNLLLVLSPIMSCPLQLEWATWQVIQVQSITFCRHWSIRMTDDSNELRQDNARHHSCVTATESHGDMCMAKNQKGLVNRDNTSYYLLTQWFTRQNPSCWPMWFIPYLPASWAIAVALILEIGHIADHPVVYLWQRESFFWGALNGAGNEIRVGLVPPRVPPRGLGFAQRSGHI